MFFLLFENYHLPLMLIYYRYESVLQKFIKSAFHVHTSYLLLHSLQCVFTFIPSTQTWHVKSKVYCKK
jgi:hypothetical protein